ncbi:hypothetical protein GQ457_05G030070 [Hibiscus cannabinus]
MRVCRRRLKSLGGKKEDLERQVKALVSHPGFLSHPPTIPTPFATPGQVVGGEPYPGVSMWRLFRYITGSCSPPSGRMIFVSVFVSTKRQIIFTISHGPFPFSLSLGDYDS